MPNNRRVCDGRTYFSTVVTHERQSLLIDDAVRAALRGALIALEQRRPFHIDAWVLLPDPIHCVSTLPDNDRDYSARWRWLRPNASGPTCLNKQALQPSDKEDFGDTGSATMTISQRIVTTFTSTRRDTDRSTVPQIDRGLPFTGSSPLGATP
jgi:REP element-mobilizing transposase RayT